MICYLVQQEHENQISNPNSIAKRHSDTHESSEDEMEGRPSIEASHIDQERSWTVYPFHFIVLCKRKEKLQGLDEAK